jgi:hypothetical protein
MVFGFLLLPTSYPHSWVAIFGYGDPQTWLQKHLRFPRLVSSTCDDDTNTIILIVKFQDGLRDCPQSSCPLSWIFEGLRDQSQFVPPLLP